jgi:hypothetical protein
MTFYGDRKRVAKAADLVKGEGAVRAGACGDGAFGRFQLDGRPADGISRGIVQLSFPPGVSTGRLLGTEAGTHETQQYLQGRRRGEKALDGGGELRDNRPV